MQPPASGPGEAVARPPRPISAAGRRHGGAPSAPRLLRPQAAVKILGESHILFYVCSIGPSMGERHEPQTSSRSIALGNAPRRMLGSPREARFVDCAPVRRGCEQEPALALTL